MDFGVGDVQNSEVFSRCCVDNASYSYRDYNGWQYCLPKLGQEWVQNGIFVKIVVCSFGRESIIIVCEFKNLNFEVWVGSKWWVSLQVGHLRCIVYMVKVRLCIYILVGIMCKKVAMRGWWCQVCAVLDFVNINQGIATGCGVGEHCICQCVYFFLISVCHEVVYVLINAA